MSNKLKKYCSKIFLYLAFCTLGVFLQSCAQSNGVEEVYEKPKIETPEVPPKNYSSFELEILDAVNNYRISINTSKLQSVDFISTVAESHTDYMVEHNSASHDNFYERSEEIKNSFHASQVGENVAFGYKTANATVNAWLNSEHHKAILESSNYTHFGISSLPDKNGNLYTTLILAEKNTTP